MAENSRHPFQESEAIFQGEIPSRLGEREAMIAEVLASLTAAGCRPDPFFDRLALDEVISNAILHGNREDPAKKVTVRAFRAADRWGFEVTDQGAGFDWKRLLASLREPLDQSRDSGRGLAIILASGADLRFLDGGRRVVMVRRTG